MSIAAAMFPGASGERFGAGSEQQELERRQALGGDALCFQGDRTGASLQDIDIVAAGATIGF